MTKKTDFTFLSSDGRTRLHGISWVPEGAAPAAVLHIVHGVAEHIDRYDPAAIAEEAGTRFSPASVAGQLTALFERVVKENVK